MTEQQHLRKCIACQSMKNREKIIKITKQSATNEIFVMPSNKIFGRSVYICKDENCVKLALKGARIEKKLKYSGKKLDLGEKIRAVLIG